VSSRVRPYAQIALQYCEDVISGSIPACWQIKAACHRHLNDLERASQGDWDYVFDEGTAAYACEFLEAFPHVKGKWAKQKEHFKMEAWQVFENVSLFGWVERADRTKYRFREAYIKVPRKNGKSFDAAGKGLLKFAGDGEYAAEVYFGATSEAQAKRLGFKVARSDGEGCSRFSGSLRRQGKHAQLTKEDGSILKAVDRKARRRRFAIMLGRRRISRTPD
jgi:phage terminase large subunit-like protein